MRARAKPAAVKSEWATFDCTSEQRDKSGLVNLKIYAPGKRFRICQ